MKIGTLTFLVLSTLVLVNCQQQTVKMPELTGRIVDQAQVLTYTEKNNLENKSKAIEQQNKSKPQVVFYITKNLPYQIDKFSNDLARYWEIGQKNVNNGILLVLATEDRKIRIEIGYGLEGNLPDMTAANIINDIKPELKNKQWYKALDKAMDEISKGVNK